MALTLFYDSNNGEVAKESYQLAAAFPARNVLYRAATDWAERTLSNLKWLFQVNPEAIRTLAKADRNIVEGFWGGTDSDGQLTLWHIVIYFDESKTSPIILAPLGQVEGWYAVGDDVTGEFFTPITSGDPNTAITSRAKVESIAWNDELQQLDPERWDVMRAIHVANLTIALSDDKLTGGPVDALEITAAGIHWIQRKPNCQSE